MNILLFSGGLDSFLAWHKLGKPQTLFVHIGMPYNEKEQRAIGRLIEVEPELISMLTSIGILNLSLTEKPSHEIPMRNMYLAMVASMYGDDIWFAFNKGETVNESHDRSADFAISAENTLSYLHGKRIHIDSPFWGVTKAQAVAEYLKNGGNSTHLLLTMSCFSEEDGHCGQCGSCFRKWVALEFNGIDTKGLFTHDPAKWDGIQEYKKRMKLQYYDAQRTYEMVEVMKKFGVW